MTQPNPIELIEQLRAANSAPQIARIIVRLLKANGIYGYQTVGQEIARLGVTEGLGNN